MSERETAVALFRLLLGYLPHSNRHVLVMCPEPKMKDDPRGF
ncbi:hypothetical protein GMO_23530 [Gluconobacter morbifer G707]|uniref:Uncharacterized protein n=1 Tax=Gluconobacter morbifer G707 TaxID=1088869 RepID=G6XLV4_9PROT|nr:hypothetical protein GMO_23530 [Gluconobacter morbifer G707]